MYPWPLEGVGPLKLLNPELPAIHQTRLELIEEPVRAALSAAGPNATALDLACSEGWFAHRLLEWGAKRVTAIDIREGNVRRARVIRDHFGIPRERLDVRQGDLFRIDVDELGTFDVVLLLGLIYHVEAPVEAVRRARRLTRGVCAIETQLTRQTEPIRHGWGTTDAIEEAEASFAARIELDAAVNPVASTGRVVSLVPNRAATEMMIRAGGFARFEWRAPAEDHNAQYRSGDRGVVVAWRE
jgi:tRNA (mo5U34)-methyltransferase